MNPISDYLLHRLTFSPRVLLSLCLAITLAMTLGLVIYCLLDVSLGSIFSILFVSGLLGIGLNELAKNLGIGTVFSFSVSVGCCSPMILGLGSVGYTLRDILGFVLMTWVICCGMMSMTQGIGRLIGYGPGGGLLLTLFLGWMTWPVWMSPYFHTLWGQWCIDHLLGYQPLFAVASLFPEMGDWTHAPIAYARLTNLGQDVLYAYPSGPGKSVALHTGLAVVGMLIALAKYPARPNASDPNTTC
ncbi:MAG: hypothetical protein KatS3mg104_1068 [Phycisphaerae bacterium]|nr:MAG: hypothetical protein KatS3mg104_1068 [Phycisphaerae bacterium]